MKKLALILAVIILMLGGVAYAQVSSPTIIPVPSPPTSCPSALPLSIIEVGNSGAGGIYGNSGSGSTCALLVNSGGGGGVPGFTIPDAGDCSNSAYNFVNPWCNLNGATDLNGWITNAIAQVTLNNIYLSGASPTLTYPGGMVTIDPAYSPYTVTTRAPVIPQNIRVDGRHSVIIVDTSSTPLAVVEAFADVSGIDARFVNAGGISHIKYITKDAVGSPSTPASYQNLYSSTVEAYNSTNYGTCFYPYGNCNPATHGNSVGLFKGGDCTGTIVGDPCSYWGAGYYNEDVTFTGFGVAEEQGNTVWGNTCISCQHTQGYFGILSTAWSGLGTISKTNFTGCSVTGATNGQTVILNTFASPSGAVDGQATIVLNGSVTGALSSSNITSITVTKPGSFLGGAPTTATCSPGTATTVSGTATLGTSDVVLQSIDNSETDTYINEKVSNDTHGVGNYGGQHLAFLSSHGDYDAIYTFSGQEPLCSGLPQSSATVTSTTGCGSLFITGGHSGQITWDGGWIEAWLGNFGIEGDSGNSISITNTRIRIGSTYGTAEPQLFIQQDNASKVNHLILQNDVFDLSKAVTDFSNHSVTNCGSIITSVSGATYTAGSSVTNAGTNFGCDGSDTVSGNITFAGTVSIPSNSVSHFATSGTFTTSSHTTRMQFVARGGSGGGSGSGASGGGSTTAGATGSGGGAPGAGVASQTRNATVAPNTTYNVSVGPGGAQGTGGTAVAANAAGSAGGAGTMGGNGGDTIIWHSDYTTSAWSVTTNVVTITTSTQALTAGSYQAFSSPSFNGGTPVRLQVLSAGLTTTQYEGNFTIANGTATEAGAGGAIVWDFPGGGGSGLGGFGALASGGAAGQPSSLSFNNVANASGGVGGGADVAGTTPTSATTPTWGGPRLVAGAGGSVTASCVTCGGGGGGPASEGIADAPDNQAQGTAGAGGALNSPGNACTAPTGTSANGNGGLGAPGSGAGSALATTGSTGANGCNGNAGNAGYLDVLPLN